MNQGGGSFKLGILVSVPPEFGETSHSRCIGSNTFANSITACPGVLKNDLPTIGDERVSVPEEFYKIVVDGSGNKLKAIAFLIPNKGTDASFYDFAVTIDQLEAKTGINFFPALPNSEEKKLEATIDLKAWVKR